MPCWGRMVGASENRRVSRVCGCTSRRQRRILGRLPGTHARIAKVTLCPPKPREFESPSLLGVPSAALNVPGAKSCGSPLMRTRPSRLSRFSAPGWAVPARAGEPEAWRWFRRARSPEEVPDRRFRGGNRDVLKSRAEHLPQHVHFGRIVQLGSGAVGVHVRYLFGGCPRGFKRAVEA